MDVDLKACIDGDKQAWDLFVQRWGGVIFAAVQRTFAARGGAVDRNDLEDAVQDVFVRLVAGDYRLLRTYDPGRASLSTWLTIVARSTAVDHLRKRRIETVPLQAHDAPEAPAAAVSNDEPPLHILSPRQRLVLRMLFDEGLSVAEAARLIGVEEQTIRSLKHKALSRLREHFAPA